MVFILMNKGLELNFVLFKTLFNFDTELLISINLNFFALYSFFKFILFTVFENESYWIPFELHKIINLFNLNVPANDNASCT